MFAPKAGMGNIPLAPAVGKFRGAIWTIPVFQKAVGLVFLGSGLNRKWRV